MRIDANQICTGLHPTYHHVVRAIVDAFNAAIDTALYSLDPTALERLGTLIAEHALRVRDIPRPSEVNGGDATDAVLAATLDELGTALATEPPSRGLINVHAIAAALVDTRARLDRAEQLLEALIAPVSMTTPTLTFRSLDGNSNLAKAIRSPEGEATIRSVLQRSGFRSCPYPSHAAGCDCGGMGGDR